MKFERKKNLTVPFFSSQNENESIFVKITDGIINSSYIPPGQTELMKVAPAINLETGEEVNLIVGAVIERTLNECLNGDYINKAFEIINRGTHGRGAQKYTKFDIYEIEDIQIQTIDSSQNTDDNVKKSSKKS